MYRGPQTMLGYWDNPQETAKAFHGGWFHSGDLVRADEDGFLYVVDRLKDMIISGGENVYCGEVEAAIADHPNVHEVAVVGSPHPKWGETPVAVVVPRDPAAPPSPADLIEFASTRLASYKKPTKVVIIDALPRNASGKVLKARCANRFSKARRDDVTDTAELLWRPSEERIQSAPITKYLRWLREERGLDFAGYEDLWRWSVTELEAFWASIWDFSGIIAHRGYDRVLDRRVMPGARWFDGALVNYAEQSLWRAREPEWADRPAVVCESESRPRMELSWQQLGEQVAAFAATLRGLGVRQGDRVVAYLPNVPESIVAMLAATSLGAVWSSAAPTWVPPACWTASNRSNPRCSSPSTGIVTAARRLTAGRCCGTSPQACRRWRR